MKSLITMTLGLLLAVTALAESKIAVVNMVDLVRLHPNRERDSKLMQDTEKEYQAKLDKQRDRFEELRGEYEKAAKEVQNPALNDKGRIDAETKAIKIRDVLVEADRDLRMEMQKLQRELGDLDARLLRQVTGELREIITKYAKDQKLDLVLDETTTAYSNASLDITNDILKRMGVDPTKRQEPLKGAPVEAPAAE